MSEQGSVKAGQSDGADCGTSKLGSMSRSDHSHVRYQKPRVCIRFSLYLYSDVHILLIYTFVPH
jgi:hypothetical protein